MVSGGGRPYIYSYCYIDSDIVVIPSRWEGFGLVAIEAMKYSKPIISLDIFATMKSIINPELELPNEIHGKNILPYILGEKEGYPHKDLFWKYNGRFNIINNDTIKVPPRYAIRSGKYKMIIEEDETFLYDLNNDVSETNNLAELENAIVKELRQKIMSWDSKTMEPRFLGLMNNDLYNKLNPDRFKY